MKTKIIGLSVVSFAFLFGFFLAADASISVDTRNPGKAHKQQLRDRGAVCDNLRHTQHERCPWVYESGFMDGERQKWRHLTLTATFSFDENYDLKFMEGLSRNLASSEIEEGDLIRFDHLGEPEGEWIFAGGYFDTPPIEWRADSRADYNGIRSINDLSQYNITYSEIGTRRFDNVFSPQVGVAATDPLSGGNIDFQGNDKFETFIMDGEYYAIATNTGIGELHGEVGETHAYATIDNRWFDEGYLSGASVQNDFVIDDSSIAVLEVSAGEDKLVSVNETVVLDGDGHHPDGEDIYYLWECEKGSFVDPEVESPTYIAPGEVGDYECRVLAYDDNNKGSTDTVTVSVVLITPPEKPTGLGYEIKDLDCGNPMSIPVLSFEYVDNDGDRMEEVEIDFPGSGYDTESFSRSANSGDTVEIELPDTWGGALDWGEEIDWRVKVKNDNDLWSEWSESVLQNREEPAPQVKIIDVDFRNENQCNGAYSVPTFIWEYTDDDGCPAQDYSITTDYGGISGTNTITDGDRRENTFTPESWDGEKEWNESIDYTIKVTSTHGFSHESGGTFDNLVRPYPQPELSWSPQEIHAESLIEFTGREGSNWEADVERKYEFDFTQYGDPSEHVENTIETEVVTETRFSVDSVGKSLSVSLEITDNDLGYSCKIGGDEDSEGDIGEVYLPLPGWEER